MIRHIVLEKEAGQRVDQLLSSLYQEYSRNYFHGLFEDNAVSVNGNAVKKSYRVSIGDEICFEQRAAVELDIPKVDLPLDIIYEDEHILVVNKAKGMVVHPAPGHYEDTLVNALMYHVKDLSDFNGILRPGIVHRMDKDTSGALLVTKDNPTHRYFAKLFKEHDLQRNYLAIVHGKVPFEHTIVEQPIGRDKKNRKRYTVDATGRYAYTDVRTILAGSEFSVLECTLRTGRTHQIRVHLKHLGFPIVGDSVYGPKKSKYREHGQYLHAHLLAFIHPNGKYMSFQAESPLEFHQFLKRITR